VFSASELGTFYSGVSIVSIVMCFGFPAPSPSLFIYTYRHTHTQWITLDKSVN